LNSPGVETKKVHQQADQREADDGGVKWLRFAEPRMRLCRQPSICARIKSLRKAHFDSHGRMQARCTWATAAPDVLLSVLLQKELVHG
jgi:hypothetical protein